KSQILTRWVILDFCTPNPRPLLTLGTLEKYSVIVMFSIMLLQTELSLELCQLHWYSFYSHCDTSTLYQLKISTLYTPDSYGTRIMNCIVVHIGKESVKSLRVSIQISFEQSSLKSNVQI